MIQFVFLKDKMGFQVRLFKRLLQCSMPFVLKSEEGSGKARVDSENHGNTQSCDWAMG
jgi:hypothetical protein